MKSGRHNFERDYYLEIKLIDNNNFTRDSLKGFRRYQEVKNVYRLRNGKMTLVCNPFTEDWDAARLLEKADYENNLTRKYKKIAVFLAIRGLRRFCLFGKGTAFY